LRGDVIKINQFVFKSPPVLLEKTSKQVKPVFSQAFQAKSVIKACFIMVNFHFWRTKSFTMQFLSTQPPKEQLGMSISRGK
jgi:hypothetical protein